MPSERELIRLTGLTQGQIRRCKNILGLPEKYKDILSEELQLPKLRQRLSEDFLIEMESSLRSVERHFPETLGNKNAVRDTLISKYRNETINSVTDFRKLSRMATAPTTLSVNRNAVHDAILKIFDSRNSVGIDAAFESTVESKAQQRKARLQAESLLVILEETKESGARIDAGLRRALELLKAMIEQVLRGGR